MIKRGEIYMVDFNPARGSEQAGLRPGLVIQNDIGNRFSPTTIIASITTADRTYPFTVHLKAKEGGLSRDSIVNLSQILTVDKERLKNKLGSLSAKRMKEVDQALLVSLGLDEA
ncbi:MAG TPA: PemK family transcriptional regulator [Firmicutes bacterium]|jgi:mRNA interferase MazF|nr:PemK family transcriptional regulator [Bacillota bacterium]